MQTRCRASFVASLYIMVRRHHQGNGSMVGTRRGNLRMDACRMQDALGGARTG